MRRVRAAIAAAAASPKRCAIYTRKSTAVGNDTRLSSLDAQREVGVAYVEARAAQDWRVLPTRYDDGGYTGANLERPAFRRLLADIEAGKIDIVVVYKVDRLSRSLLDFAQVMGFFDRHGVAFVSVTQNFSTADAVGRLTLNLLMSFAEFEREMISERTRDKIAVARRRGYWTGGIVPFGYRSVDRRLQIDPPTAPLARNVFTEYLATRQIVPILGKLDLLAPRRTRTGAPRPWERNDVRRILDNPIYAGLIRAGDELVPAGHEAIVDRATFDRVHEARREAGDTGPDPESDFWLRGLVRCRACRARLVGVQTRRGRSRFRYYRCHTRDRRGADACPLTPVRADDLEALVYEEIRALMASGTVAELTAALNQRLAQHRTTLCAERERLPSELAAATARADRIAGELARCSSSDRPALESELTEFLAAAATAERRLIEVDADIARHANSHDPDWVSRALAHFDPVWAALPPQGRSQLVARLVSAVVAGTDGTVQITWQSWLSPPQVSS